MKKAVESGFRKDILDFQIGDTVNVSVRITEGDKERTQVFNGVVIGRRGSGMSESFTVRRIIGGEGVERTFPVHNPRIASLEVTSRGKVRRAKLYYLRQRVGKATRLKELQTGKEVAAEAAAKAAKAEAAAPAEA